MPEFATLQELRAHLNLSSATGDGELALMLDAAEETVRGLVGSFAAGAVTETVAVHGGTVFLPSRPVGPVAVDGETAGFIVRPDARLVLNVPADRQWVTVSYEAGDGRVPAAVTLATLIIAAHLWETQRGTSPTALQAADTNEFVPGLGFTIPNRAKELLEPPYRISAGQIL